MIEFYEKQPDGSLKPLEIPSHIIKATFVYFWLKNQSLDLEEIQFILRDGELLFPLT